MKHQLKTKPKRQALYKIGQRKRGPLVWRKCLKCKKKFKARIYETERGRGKFCSASCNASYYNKLAMEELKKE
jgi:hypothetical protein